MCFLFYGWERRIRKLTIAIAKMAEKGLKSMQKQRQDVKEQKVFLKYRQPVLKNLGVGGEGRGTAII